MRTVKLRAVRENRKLKDMIADLLRRGLSQELETPATTPKRVQLPLVRCAQNARTDEMTPDRVAQILLDEEAHGVAA